MNEAKGVKRAPAGVDVPPGMKRLTGGNEGTTPSSVRPQQYAGRRTWRRRPVLSLAIRITVFILPVSSAIAATTIASRLVVRHGWSLPARLGWVILMFALAVGVSAVVAGVADRVLPLSALCHLNLAFPKEAPDRIKVALRMGNPGRAEKVVQEFRERGLSADPQTAAEQTLELVAALNTHDRKTRGHSERVRALAEVIAEELQLPEADRNLLRWASLLHDIGKLSVPAEILNSNGAPTDEEWETLKLHPGNGQWRIEPLRGWLGDWANCIYEHHERFDGTGYPAGLRGDQMALGSRIVAVADAFEVMTATRSYKKPMSYDDARAELVHCAGTHFDPVVVRAFVRVGRKRTLMAGGVFSSMSQFASGNTPFGTLVQAVTGGMAATGSSMAVTSAVFRTKAVATTTTTILALGLAAQAETPIRLSPAPLEWERPIPVQVEELALTSDVEFAYAGEPLFEEPMELPMTFAPAWDPTPATESDMVMTRASLYVPVDGRAVVGPSSSRPPSTLPSSRPSTSLLPPTLPPPPPVPSSIGESSIVTTTVTTAAPSGGVLLPPTTGAAPVTGTTSTVLMDTTTTTTTTTSTTTTTAVPTATTSAVPTATTSAVPTTTTTAVPTTTTTTTTVPTTTTTTTTVPTTTTTTTTPTTTTTTTTVVASTTLGFSLLGPAAFTASVAPLTVAYPAGTQSSDLLLLIALNAVDRVTTAPAGWTLLSDQTNSGPAFRLSVWWKLSAGELSETVNTDTNGNGESVWVARYKRPSGYPPAPTSAAAPSKGSQPSAVTLAPGAVTTSQSNAVVVSVVAIRENNTLSLQTPNGFTLQATATQSSGVGMSVGIADMVVAVSGATPPLPVWSQTGPSLGGWIWSSSAFV